MSLARVQFIITLVIFLICMIFLPQLGFGGMTMRIYPCLASGYFILFLMYAEIIFMYYFNDMKGCVLTGLVFCLITLVGSIISSHFTEIWYGAGLVVGSFAGWTVAYGRLRWMEKHLDVHIFCNGHLLKKKKVIVRHQKYLTDMNSKKGTKEKMEVGDILRLFVIVSGVFMVVRQFCHLQRER